MQKIIETVHGDKVIITRDRSGFAPDLIIEHRHTSIGRLPVQLSTDDIEAIVVALNGMLPEGRRLYVRE